MPTNVVRLSVYNPNFNDPERTMLGVVVFTDFVRRSFGLRVLVGGYKMLHMYTPEMGGTCPPEIKTHATLSHYGQHYFLKSAIGPDKIRGQGITYLGRLCPEPDILRLERYCTPESPYNGYYEYKVTERAFEKLQDKIDIGYSMLLS